MAQEKEYGLILPKSKGTKAKAPIPSRPARSNVFGDDSDEDVVDWTEKSLKAQSHSSLQQRQSKLYMKQALKDDPTVYQYDELFDKMEQSRSNKKESEKGDRKPKYITTLLVAAEKRQKENEARIEREVQKEREKEGDMYKDKEAFVTSAYREKMEELQRLAEEEKRKDNLDEWTNVTKQKDLSGFYRHLYRQQLGDKQDDDKMVVAAEVQTTKTVQKEEYPRENRTRIDHQRSHHHHSQAQSSTHMRYRNKIPKQSSSRGRKHERSESPPTRKHPKLETEESASASGGHIWTKRTVGKVLKESRERFFERLEARLF